MYNGFILEGANKYAVSKNVSGIIRKKDCALWYRDKIAQDIVDNHKQDVNMLKMRGRRDGKQ